MVAGGWPELEQIPINHTVGELVLRARFSTLSADP